MGGVGRLDLRAGGARTGRPGRRRRKTGARRRGSAFRIDHAERRSVRLSGTARRRLSPEGGEARLRYLSRAGERRTPGRREMFRDRPAIASGPPHPRSRLRERRKARKTDPPDAASGRLHPDAATCDRGRLRSARSRWPFRVRRPCPRRLLPGREPRSTSCARCAVRPLLLSGHRRSRAGRDVAHSRGRRRHRCRSHAAAGAARARAVRCRDLARRQAGERGQSLPGRRALPDAGQCRSGDHR